MLSSTRKVRKNTLFFIYLLFLHQINFQTMQLLFIGTTEIILIVFVVLLLFGGRKIPEMMRGLGKGVKSFKDGVNGKDEETENGERKTEN